MNARAWLLFTALLAGCGLACAEETAATDSDARQGAVLFNAMNCDGCHGGGAMGFVGPSLVDGRWRYGGDEQTLIASIRDGRPQGMPAYGTLLPESTIRQLVAYLQSQALHKDVPTIAWPE